MLRDDASLLDILNAGRKIAHFSEDLSIEEIAEDGMRLSAILYKFIVIGEATRRLFDELRNAHPEIPWKKMAGMRNILTHQYDKVDLKLLKEAVKDVLPRVVKQVESLVNI